MSILDNLNEMQKKAAKLIEGQSLILAGAGSGKTRTVTFKIAHMIKEKNISPSSILALTFTNKAAKEMKERIETLVGDDAKEIVTSTFHSFAVKILRVYSTRLGYTSNFNIYDTNDQSSIVKKIIKQKKLEEKFKDKEVVSKISKWKELGYNYNNISDLIDINYDLNLKLKNIFKEYQETLAKNNAMDFSDLLLNFYELLKDEYVLEKIQDKYRYILIDEYQDTNDIQYKIVRLIASKYKNICVVGDEDQSIYAFRGANIQNILNFEKDYPNANIIKLEQNYRSTQNILNAANSVIKNNNSSKGKKLWSLNDKGEKIKIYAADDVNDEARFLTKTIKEKIGKDLEFKDITVLYRINSQSRPIEEEFIRNNIPYKIFGGKKFFDRREIKDIISYLLLINNDKDSHSFERVINVPKRGIGDKSIDTLISIANRYDVSLFDAITKIDNELSERSKSKFINFRNMIIKFKEKSKIVTTSELLKDLIDEIDFYNYLSSLENTEDRKDNIFELINSITFKEEERGFLELSDYLEEVSLNSMTDDLNEDENYVKLMSIHASKGLEFDTVFLIGVEEGMFPRSNDDENDEEIEEERRIFYVALTRAKRLLYLSYAVSRTLWGNHGFYYVKNSRFIDEIDKNLLELLNQPKKVEKPTFMNKIVINEPKVVVKKEYFHPEFSKGDFVSHNVFGVGEIINIEENGINVKFSVGIKKIASSLASKFLKKV